MVKTNFKISVKPAVCKVENACFGGLVCLFVFLFVQFSVKSDKIDKAELHSRFGIYMFMYILEISLSYIANTKGIGGSSLRRNLL